MEPPRRPSRSGRNSIHDGRSSISSFRYSSKESGGHYVPFNQLQLQQQNPTPPIDSNIPIWKRVIYTYYDELQKGGISGLEIEKDLWAIDSPADLLDQIHDLKVPKRMANTWLGSIDRSKNIILGLNDFAIVAAWATGMDGKVPAVVWGSIKLLLNVSHASP